ncbi:MAG: hypothetical protein Q8M24_23005 [Pseudolabrys sp.]|nr:hypothetical protein [Pseudolabrys sp.]MDP2298322.1 hypothetical protein [Pseudolabrys sp.]
MAIISIATASVAHAKPKHTNKRTPTLVVCDMRGCSDNPAAQAATTRQSAQAPRERVRVRRNNAAVVCTAQGCSDNVVGRDSAAAGGATTRIADANGNGTIVGGRPSGCPHRFCGCAASLYVFGEIRPQLNLAANWARKFPRTAPASGMVAARSGHVMVLMSHAGGDEWMVHDGNSGGGRTREHVRSIRGYTIVNPRATVTAER